MALVSIVIPTHDRFETLTKRTLPSVLEQRTVHDLEILVVGDGTDAQTVEYMVDLAERDRRVRFWNLPKQERHPDANVEWGIQGTEARNWGHDHATGTYVGGLDDDDAFSHDHVDVLVNAIKLMDVDFAYGRSIAYRTHEGKTYEQPYGRWPPGFGAFCDGAGIWKRSLQYRYEKAASLERGLPTDGDLWTRMYADGVRFFFVDQVVHYYWPAR